MQPLFVLLPVARHRNANFPAWSVSECYCVPVLANILRLRAILRGLCSPHPSRVLPLVLWYFCNSIAKGQLSKAVIRPDFLE